MEAYLPKIRKCYRENFNTYAISYGYPKIMPLPPFSLLICQEDRFQTR